MAGRPLAGCRPANHTKGEKRRIRACLATMYCCNMPPCIAAICRNDARATSPKTRVKTASHAPAPQVGIHTVRWTPPELVPSVPSSSGTSGRKNGPEKRAPRRVTRTPLSALFVPRPLLIGPRPHLRWRRRWLTVTMSSPIPGPGLGAPLATPLTAAPFSFSYPLACPLVSPPSLRPPQNEGVLEGTAGCPLAAGAPLPLLPLPNAAAAGGAMAGAAGRRCAAVVELNTGSWNTSRIPVADEPVVSNQVTFILKVRARFNFRMRISKLKVEISHAV
eukprot:1183134-Prorocentrum_minimum.AAC.1